MDREEASNNLTLTIDELVRSIGVNRNAPHAFFLGAGASVSSGVQSASSCIWEWKRRIFLTKNPGLETQFRDLSLVSVQQKIQRWLDIEGIYPSLNAVDEYGFYVERCYPIAHDRRQYFQTLIEGVTPYIGYQLLCLLAESGVIRAIWTTNFDGLTIKAAATSKVTPIEVGLDTTNRVIRQSKSGELLHVAIHGDYRYDSLMNTDSEVQNQDKTLRGELIKYLEDTTLIVSGYSGRDESVMQTLLDAYSRNGTGRLYWCGRETPEPNGLIRELLITARMNGREAYYIQVGSFDDLLVRLSLHCLTGNLLDIAQEIRSRALPESEELSPPFSIQSALITGVIKSNAFVIQCPSEVLEFKAPQFLVQGAWKLLEEQTQGTRVIAVPLAGKVLALGTVTDVKATFAGAIDNGIERSPIVDKELSITDGAVISLLTKALVRAIAETRGFNTDGRNLLWTPEVVQTTKAYDTICKVHDAALLYLRRYGGKQYLIIKPTVHGTSKEGEKLSNEVDKELKRLLLTKQYNREFNDAANRWRERIFPQNKTIFEYPPNSGSGFKFHVTPVPAFASISAQRGGKPITLPPNSQRHIVYSGMQYQEPLLLFSNTQGDGFVKDVYPVRGMVRNQPYDYSLTKRGISKDIRIGVICPARDSRNVSTYLNGLQHRKQPDSKREYLLEYPGFGLAFGLPLDIPQPQYNAWVECPELDSSLGVKEGAAELGRQITSCIKSLTASASPNVILIYIPERWRLWEHYNEDEERYDLHDYVKAYCVQQGIATQFLRENTLIKPYQCEVLWWLALSFYAKAMRTPWVLEGTDSETAFMGIGYSLDANMPRGKHVILGCSHIYNSEGLGLRYKLSKIEDPLIRRGNPFMSRDDARRLGEGARQLFFESRGDLPKRVVIHKLTPFRKSEREGLLDGLSGIKSIDMLEINVDPALRYVASRISSDGKFQGDGFPVRRGTAVVLDRRKALLWVHGTTEAVIPHKSYYQGKSRIPAPLIMIRHHGSSNLSTLATELLGLSKMNWNTFDMYTKLPATIQSSNEIARIGTLLERFGPMSYDYRLFI